LKPVFHLIGARVETRRLSATSIYGSGGVNVHRGPHRGLLHPLEHRNGAAVHGVAVQVAFESKGLKPGFHFIG
jgi:hypothetical protein